MKSPRSIKIRHHNLQVQYPHGKEARGAQQMSLVPRYALTLARYSVLTVVGVSMWHRELCRAFGECQCCHEYTAGSNFYAVFVHPDKQCRLPVFVLGVAQVELRQH
jgi:hypothetical protein